MSVPQELAELRQQVAELQAWKQQVESVWQKIVEVNDGAG